MKYKHPFQIVLSNRNGTLLFTATQNKIQVFDAISGEKRGEWTDEIDIQESIKENVQREQQRQLKLQNQRNESETEPEKKKHKSHTSEAKVPTPGPGAPKVYNYIRNLYLTDDESYLICTTGSDKAAVILELELDNKENILHLIKRQPFPKRPSAISVSSDNSQILLGDKFGDVYSIPIDSAPAKKINGETEPILGHVSMLTDLTIGVHDGKEYVLTADRDEHIRVSSYPKAFVIKHWIFGHKQFVSSLLIPSWNPNILISGGGDDHLFVWDWIKDSNMLIDKFNIREIIEPYLSDVHLAPSKFQNEDHDLREIAVSKIISLSTANEFAVLVEATKVILFFKLDESDKILLEKIVDIGSTVISITSSDDYVFAAIEDENQLIKTVDIKSKEIVDNKVLSNSLTASSSIEIDCKEEQFPLYTAYQLRKRSEH